MFSRCLQMRAYPRSFVVSPPQADHDPGFLQGVAEKNMQRQCRLGHCGHPSCQQRAHERYLAFLAEPEPPVWRNWT